MNSYTLAAQQIKDTISAQDVGQVLGLEIRHGRCQCPMHGGHDFNCVLYKGNRGFYCHVCKSGGDVISFAQRYHDMSFKDIVSWFNNTFRMGMDLDKQIDADAQRRAEKAQRMRNEAMEFSQWKARVQFDLALTADEVVQRLEEIRDANAPKTPDEQWNDAFCTSVRLLPSARRFAQDCIYGCVEVKQ